MQKYSVGIRRKQLDLGCAILSLSVKAEGLTAIECWVIACIIFVFGALLEYTVILLKLKLKKVRIIFICVYYVCLQH